MKELNPIFENLSPETILNHVQVQKQELSKEQNPFPVEVFPELIQKIIRETNESLKFPVDFIGAAIMYAVSVAIGNTHKVRIMQGYEQNAVLYLSIVGKAGTNKTHPIAWTLKPINQKDKIKFEEYQEQFKKYEEFNRLSPTEKKKQEKLKFPKKPKWEQLLVSDFTPESLTEIMDFNKRGIGVYADELAAWFNNFNRYNKGSEEQFWLSIWSGTAIRINRKTSNPIMIQNPFVSVIGTVQPAVLEQLALNRTENGFIDRLLFVVPDKLQKEYWSEKELNPATETEWFTILENLLNLEVGNQPEVLQFSPEARAEMFQFNKNLTDLCNRTESDAIRGIYAKIEQYAIRFSLLLEMLRFACSESDKQAISLQSVQGAVKLVEYFQNAAIKVHKLLNEANPFDKLPADKKKLYDALPEVFTTGEGIKISLKLEVMKERAFKEWVKDKNLFKYLERGKYEKLL
ncbi:DUF3987 domain-containing protein [Mongoliitalea lutea]|uniref:DUF3987 domain-containing protein n=1 Tax=Mongoliitalea lutea TaxID=849756 RepID=A0A8J3CZU2_9BACT|nr:DUF3987 domain-containing protein [Mongoliitalea lutea]GHB53735.1 hypothetical protein GCM10008106_37640 [Mongoliitalea lutea]